LDGELRRYLAYADDQISRLIDSIEQTGELDNTLIFYIVGDNGPSAEAGWRGLSPRLPAWSGTKPGCGLSKRIDQNWRPGVEPHGPRRLGVAMASPAMDQAGRQHFGGTRNPMVVHWPKRIKAKGELRTQFHHVIDIVPTVLEACQVPAPKTVNGSRKKPIEGVSMMYTFDDAKAKSRRTTQYFEMFVNRAFYHDGWWRAAGSACPGTWSDARRFPERPVGALHVEDDFSQADDLAAKEPARLKELQALFVEEAK